MSKEENLIVSFRKELISQIEKETEQEIQVRVKEFEQHLREKASKKIVSFVDELKIAVSRDFESIEPKVIIRGAFMSKEIDYLYEMHLKYAPTKMVGTYECETEESNKWLDNLIIAKKKVEALEIIKENLVVNYDESENDKPCLILGVKVSKDNLVVIYETFDKEKIDLLKEVLL